MLAVYEPACQSKKQLHLISLSSIPDSNDQQHYLPRFRSLPAFVVQKYSAIVYHLLN